MTATITILIAAVAAIVAALITYFAVKASLSTKIAVASAEAAAKDNSIRELKENQIQSAAALEERHRAETDKLELQQKEALQALEERHRTEVEKLEQNHKAAIETIEKHQKEALEATKVALAAENDKALKAREDALKKEAEETINKMTAPLQHTIKTMTEAFEAQKESHNKEMAAVKEKFEETAKNLGAQSEKIGIRAEKLADALRHDNKMQGNWGEMQLENIFQQEGLVKGRDFEREEYLRDEKGEIVFNADTAKKMRPDFILHFPDMTDVIVDSKMNIDAYVDWYNAETDEERDAAEKRNYAAVRNQIDGLSKKSYNEYMSDGHKTLPYVIMYVSNYGALALAKKTEPNIVNEAFKKNVLITTEETIMPFLRLIKTAWITVEQVRNQEKIVKAAQQMVERVADLVTANEAVGKALRAALEQHGKCTAKLADGGQSILTAARTVEKLGVPVNPKKRLALGTDEIEENNEDSLS
ncbi:MAG: DNA recombination protein RmuC [Bacteroidales bacterium]|nr:DNA recombination protein RmuC [Bacteroidales bacterium]